jgi:hypothetical protein
MAKDFRETVIKEARLEGRREAREELLAQFRKRAKAKGLEREPREILDELGAETEKGKAARGKPSRGKKP